MRNISYILALTVAITLGVIVYDVMRMDLGGAGASESQRPKRHGRSNVAAAPARLAEHEPDLAAEGDDGAAADEEIDAEAAQAAEERAEAERAAAESARDKAAADWETIIDRLYNAGPEYVPTAKEVKDFKAIFDRLDVEQKLEHIPAAQNLLSDAAFGCLETILMDVAEPEDVLSSVYHDMLNRAEELKMPLLRKIAADKRHPMATEAAELLEVIEE